MHWKCLYSHYLIFVAVHGRQLHGYCLVQYSFKSGQEHPIPKMPHGNSKKKKTPYVRTWESIRDQLKIVAGKMIAREAIHHAITDGLGGLQSCVGLGQVPRNRQQVKDIARHKDVSKGSYPKNMSGTGRTSDPWYILLKDQRKGLKLKTAFVREVRVGAEPFCVVGTDSAVIRWSVGL